MASHGKRFRDSATTLDRGAEGPDVDFDRTYKVEASPFVGVRGNDLWVGWFDEKSSAPRCSNHKSSSAFAYPYRVNAFGGPNRSGPAFPVPAHTQGMVVTDQHFIFSCSLGHNKDSTIAYPTSSQRSRGELFHVALLWGTSEWRRSYWAPHPLLRPGRRELGVAAAHGSSLVTSGFRWEWIAMCPRSGSPTTDAVRSQYWIDND